MDRSPNPPDVALVERQLVVGRPLGEPGKGGADVELVVDRGGQERIAGVTAQTDLPRHQLPSHSEVLDRVVSHESHPSRLCCGVATFVEHHRDTSFPEQQLVEVVRRREFAELIDVDAVGVELVRQEHLLRSQGEPDEIPHVHRPGTFMPDREHHRQQRHREDDQRSEDAREDGPRRRSELPASAITDAL